MVELNKKRSAPSMDLQKENKRTKVAEESLLDYFTRAKSSMEVFSEFIIRDPVFGYVDTSGILSKECFDKWLATRKVTLKNPELTFVQTIRGHIIGCSKVGRKPFEADEEEDLLIHVRKPKQWPCFETSTVNYGCRGLNIRGFHERAREKQADDALDMYLFSLATVCSPDIPLEPLEFH